MDQFAFCNVLGLDLQLQKNCSEIQSEVGALAKSSEKHGKDAYTSHSRRKIVGKMHF